MEHVMIYLKSGHTIEVICKKWTFKRNNLSGEYVGYTFEGIKEPKDIGIVPSQIAAHVVKRIVSD